MLHKLFSGTGKVLGALTFVLRRKRKEDTVVIYTYPKFIFFWPIWFLGLALLLPLRFGWISPAAAGWTYIAALIVVVIALGFELSRNEFIFTMVTIVLIWVAGLWLRDAKHVLFFSMLWRKFYHLKPNYDSNFGLVISIIMTVFGLITFVKSRLNDRWEFSSNSIEHYQFGRQDDSLARGAKTVRFSYPDTAELFLLGAGTITIYSADGRTVVRRLENIPFLRFREKTIDVLYKSTQVRLDTAELEEQSADHGDHSSDTEEHDTTTVQGG